MSPNKTIAIVGGGPAGLMAAERLTRPGIEVHVYEAMPSLGRKFLRAGVGGLNITHSEPREQFIARYSQPERLVPLIRAFGPAQMIEWLRNLGFETFTGSSGRVFPVGMKSSPILRAWLKRLDEAGVVFHTNHKWIDVIASRPACTVPQAHVSGSVVLTLKSKDCGEAISSPTDTPAKREIDLGLDTPFTKSVQGYSTLAHRPDGTTGMTLVFDTPDGTKTIQADAVLLALGGGSWPKLGSTGGWIPILETHGVPIAPLRPANCGFDVAWTDHFKTKFDGAPLKAVTVTFKDVCKQGEFIVTKDGVEGSLIYALSAPIRDEIEASGQAVIHLDLAPDWTTEKLVNRLSLPRGSRSMGSHLQKTVAISGVKAGLLWEFVAREDFQSPEKLAAAMKSLSIPLLRPRPLAEAISSAGGVRFEALDEGLMLKALPGIFCAGEMLDWEAPTGGYLLTGCFATACQAADGILDHLNR